MKKNPRLLSMLLIFIISIGMLISGCSQSTEALVSNDSQEVAEKDDQPIENVSEQKSSVAESDADSSIEEPGEDISIQDPDPGKEDLPEPRKGLEATDPATVSLASGKIQLIELFAFW